MKLIDPSSSLMECKVCGKRHIASLQSGDKRKDGVTRYFRGSWQCTDNCELLSQQTIPRGTEPRKAKLLRSIRKSMREMEKDMPFKDDMFDI
jgi:hypothetical protein